MGSIWLRDAFTVIRAGVPSQFNVLTVPGWENRSNASGGFEAVKGLVIHHTASGPSADGWPDVNYETFQDAEHPNAMLKVSRKGEIFIMTAGSANTQGLGGPIIGVPLNRGNFQLIGIELSNNGVGEPYPDAQQEATLQLCRCLVASYGARFGWNHGSIIAHFEWAPSRKNDPAGPSRWSPGGGRWNMNAFRTDVGSVSPPPPPPPTGSKFMLLSDD